ncbi:MAG: hypothetical protein ABIR24_09570 [Verrucomicrobiota bacterium]
MNAYFFTAGVTEYLMRPTVSGSFGQTIDRLETADTCAGLIVYGNNRDDAQKQFETWIASRVENEKPVQTEIKRMVVAPLVDQLFTESGHEPVDWATISEKADASLIAAEVDDFEQGYWADVNQLVRADKLSADMESLRRELPEDIRTGLNWSSDKLFYFLVSVLSPRHAQSHFSQEGGTIDLRSGEIRRADSPEEEFDKFNKEQKMFPQLVDKKAAALVYARNSVVAAWLWRKFCATEGLPADEIRIDPWCGAIPT